VKQILIGMLMVGALALSGCGAKSCKDLCNKPCNGVTTTDCNAGCVKVEAINKASACGSKYDTMMSCLSGLNDSDRCSSTRTLCNTESISWAGCVTDYCNAHPSDPECK